MPRLKDMYNCVYYNLGSANLVVLLLAYQLIRLQLGNLDALFSRISDVGFV